MKYLSYYGKKYGTMEKSMELWYTIEKQWYYRKKKLWHDAKNYCTIVVVCRFEKRATE